MNRIVPTLLVLGIVCAAGTQDPPKPPPPPKAPEPIVFDFEKDAVGATPKDFTVALTGGGPAPAFAVQKDADGKGQALVQSTTDDTDARFPLCVYDKWSGKDVRVTTRFKAVDGKVDRAAGLVVRTTDKDNYYIARANALEDNVRLYKVVKGARKQFAGEKAKVTSGEWHTLALEVRGDHFKVSFDGKQLFEGDDATFTEAGKIGVWTKSDSVTWFDDLKIEPLAAEPPK